MKRRGRPVLDGEEKQIYTCNLYGWQLEEMDKMCKKRKIGKSVFIREAVTACLERYNNDNL